MEVSVESKNIDSQSLQEPVDAKVEVSISNNKLQASLNITPPENGGQGHNFLSIRKILASKGITYGLNTQKLLSICENPIYNQDILIAEGIAPISGVDGRFDIKFCTEPDSRLVTKEDGTVDFYNLDNIENVKKDQLLCTIVLPKEGTDGMSVLGKKINCIKGKPVPALAGKNATLSEDGTEIRAAIDGQVNYIQGKIKVDETFYIKDDVDPTTGNIKVVGNVVIGGSVLPGFIVEATGNIQIENGISSVTLISGGNILLSRGIIGGDIRCEGNLTSRFIENCKARVKGDVKTDYVMNSDMQCGKSLQAVNSISKIVGGNYLVGENVHAKIIGSPANVKTYLEIGIDPEIIKRQKKLEGKFEELEAQSKSLKSLITLLEKFEASGQLDPEKEKSLKSALFSYKTLTDSMEGLRLELDEITESIRSKTSGRITCSGILYSGTTVKIASAKKRIRETLFNKSLYYLNQQIHIGKA